MVITASSTAVRTAATATLSSKQKGKVQTVYVHLFLLQVLDDFALGAHDTVRVGAFGLC